MLASLMPEWMPPLIEKVGRCFNTEDPIQLQAWLHDGGDNAWHIDIMPTVVEQNDGFFVRGFSFHLSALLQLLETADAVGDLNSLSITGDYEKHPVHILVHLGPDDDEDDDEDEALPSVNAKVSEKASLPN